MATREAVVRSLTLFSRAFAGALSHEKIEVYAAALEDVDDAQLVHATTHLIRTYESQFIPPPSIIRRAVYGKPRLDVARIIAEIDKIGDYSPAAGWTAPAVAAVRERLGGVIAEVYAETDPIRLFSDDPTSRDIARRDFATMLDATVADVGTVSLPPWALASITAPPQATKLLPA